MAALDPCTLSTLSTWYLVTNLPTPGAARAQTSRLPAADLAELVRLYGLRLWVEQSYKQTKYALGWSDYQVRSAVAIRRHWALVCCAFSFCWYHLRQQERARTPVLGAAHSHPAPVASAPASAPSSPTEDGRGKVSPLPQGRALLCWPVALRAVRAWLEPALLLWRYWHAWSTAPPPAPLAQLFERLWHGHGLDLYVRPLPLSTKYR